MADSIKPTAIGPFKPGVNNRRPEYDLIERTREGRAFYLRSAVNVDITAEGVVRRRHGVQRAIAGTACHSFWSGDNVTGYFGDGTALKRVTGAGTNLVQTTLRNDLTGQPISFAQTPLGVFYSDGAQLRRIDASGDRPAGVSTLQADPVVSAAVGGSLPAGYYELVFSYRNAAGEESAATYPVQVVVPANGKISIAQLPAAWPSDVTALVVYMTPQNAKTLLRAATLTAAATTFSIAVTPAFGERAVTELLAPMPAGQIVRYSNGRLLVAQGSVLSYSEPFAPALRNPAKNYIPFAAPITVVEANQFGIYVCADQTYWINGDIAQATPDPVLPYGAVLGSSGQIPNDNVCFWMSVRGMVRGDQDGKVTNLQEANVAVRPGARGAVAFRERDGMKQLLASSFGSGSTQMAASSWMSAEIIRKGTVL